MSAAWTTMKVLWAIAVNLVQLLIMAEVLGAGQNRFESVVLAGIVLTYVAVRQGFYGLSYYMDAVHLQASKRFIILADLLKGPGVEDYQEAHKESERDLKKRGVRWWIDIIGLSLAWFMALWGLLRAA